VCVCVYIVLIDFRSMEFSKMSHYITFGMGIVVRGASGALLSQAAESRVKGEQKECSKCKYSFPVL